MINNVKDVKTISYWVKTKNNVRQKMGIMLSLMILELQNHVINLVILVKVQKLMTV